VKILHISDLHFPVRLGLTQLRRKSLIGYVNYALRRKRKHPYHKILVETLRQMDYDCLIVSGDITNVSAEKEFAEARKILEPILDERAFLIPGNHDRYTVESFEKRYFEIYFAEFIGKTIPSVGLGNFYLRWKEYGGISLIGWDSNLPLPAMQAQGYLDPEVVRMTIQFLNASNIEKYMVVCHHPIWNPEERQESDYHRLLNREEVLQILQSRPPIAYFHGHLHTNWVREPDGAVPFYILNSASSTRVSDASHDSGFHSFACKDSTWTYSRYSYDETCNAFLPVQNVTYKGNTRWQM